MAEAVQTSFLPVFATAGISATSGQEVAADLADTINWFLTRWCNCVPPDFVLHFFKGFFTLGAVALGLYIHYLVSRQKSA